MSSASSSSVLSSSTPSSGGFGVGVVGLGWALRVQVKMLRLVGFSVNGVCGRRSKETTEAANQHGIPFHTTSIDELAARPDITLIIICTPPAAHLAAALAVLKAGKHVLLEKPFTTNTAEAAQLYHAAVDARKQRKNGYAPLAIVDHELRFLPSVQFSRALVDSPLAVGKIHQVTFTHFGALAISTTWNWWFDRTAAGGIWNAIGSHAIDLVAFITQSRCTNVSAHLSAAHKELPDDEGKMKTVTADEIANVQLTFQQRSGQSFPVLFSFSCVHGGHFKQKQLIIGGELGTIVWDLESTRTTFFPANPAATDAALKIADKLKVNVERLEIAKTANKAAGAPTTKSSSSTSSSSPASSLPVSEVNFASSIPASIPNWPDSLPATGFTVGTFFLFQHLFHLLPKLHSAPAEDMHLYADFVDGVSEQLALDAGILSTDAKGVEVSTAEIGKQAKAELDELEKLRTR